MTEPYELRAPGRDIFTNARAGAFSVAVDSDTLGSVGTAGDWTAGVFAKAYNDLADTLITPTISVDIDTNVATFEWSDADAATLMGAGVSRATYHYAFRHDDGTLVYEVRGRFVMDRNGTSASSADAVTLTLVNETLTLTGTVAVSATALTRYRTPKGNRAGVCGTSIELGSGGDVSLPFGIGRWSNGSWWTHLCINSGGLLNPIKNAGYGGYTLGGIGELMADAPAGSTTIDVAVTTGPCLPNVPETLFLNRGDDDGEALNLTVATDIDGGRRFSFNEGTLTNDHYAGESIRWGMIGSFVFDFEDLDLDIIFVGGPINNVNKTGWTSENIAIGQQILADLVEAHGAVPVMCTITPASSSNDYDAVDDANRALRNSFYEHRHWWADMFPVLVNPATRTSQTALTADGLHPNQEGAQRLAAQVMAQVVDRMEIRQETRHQAMSDDDAVNLLPSASFASGSTTDSWGDLPTDWTRQTFFSTGITTSLVAPRLLDRQTGQVLRVTANAGKGTVGIKYSVADVSGWEIGDRVFMKCWARLSGFKPDGFCLAVVKLNVTGPSGSVPLPCGPYQWLRDFDGGVFSAEHEIPGDIGASVTAAEFQIVIEGPPFAGADVAYGMFDVMSPYLVNLTQQEIS